MNSTRLHAQLARGAPGRKLKKQTEKKMYGLHQCSSLGTLEQKRNFEGKLTIKEKTLHSSVTSSYSLGVACFTQIAFDFVAIKCSR